MSQFLQFIFTERYPFLFLFCEECQYEYSLQSSFFYVYPILGQFFILLHFKNTPYICLFIIFCVFIFIVHIVFFLSNNGQASALKVAYIFKIFGAQSCNLPSEGYLLINWLLIITTIVICFASGYYYGIFKWCTVVFSLLPAGYYFRY